MRLHVERSLQHVRMLLAQVPPELGRRVRAEHGAELAGVDPLAPVLGGLEDVLADALQGGAAEGA